MAAQAAAAAAGEVDPALRELAASGFCVLASQVPGLHPLKVRRGPRRCLRRAHLGGAPLARAVSPCTSGPIGADRRPRKTRPPPPCPRRVCPQNEVVPQLMGLQQRYARVPSSPLTTAFNGPLVIAAPLADQHQVEVAVTFDVVQAPASFAMPVMQKRPWDPPFQVGGAAAAGAGRQARCCRDFQRLDGCQDFHPAALAALPRPRRAANPPCPAAHTQVRMTWRAALPLQFSTRVAAFAVDEKAVTSMLSWQVPSSADAQKSLLEHQQERTVVLSPEVRARAPLARWRPSAGPWAPGSCQQASAGRQQAAGSAAAVHRGRASPGPPPARCPHPRPRPSPQRASTQAGNETGLHAAEAIFTFNRLSFGQPSSMRPRWLVFAASLLGGGCVYSHVLLPTVVMSRMTEQFDKVRAWVGWGRLGWVGVQAGGVWAR